MNEMHWMDIYRTFFLNTKRTPSSLYLQEHLPKLTMYSNSKQASKETRKLKTTKTKKTLHILLDHLRFKLDITNNKIKLNKKTEMLQTLENWKTLFILSEKWINTEIKKNSKTFSNSMKINQSHTQTCGTEWKWC